MEMFLKRSTPPNSLTNPGSSKKLKLDKTLTKLFANSRLQPLMLEHDSNLLVTLTLVLPVAIVDPGFET